MTHRNLAPQKILPGQLVLRTEGACDLDQQQLLEVWARQRQRFELHERGIHAACASAVPPDELH